MRTGADRRQVVAHRSKPGFVAGREDQRVACVRETRAQSVANAARGAGDKDCSVLLGHAAPVDWRQHVRADWKPWYDDAGRATRRHIPRLMVRRRATSTDAHG